MTRRAKVAVTIPADVLARARAAVEGGAAANLSAFVSDALAERIGSIELATMLDEALQHTGGPLTDEERASIDSEAGWA